MDKAAAYVVTGRTVFTYEPDGWPAGVVTGVPDEVGGFSVEHMIAFDRHVLLPLMTAGIDAAWSCGYAYITFCLPDAFPLTPRLKRLAERFGFHRYYQDADRSWWVRYAG